MHALQGVISGQRAAQREACGRDDRGPERHDDNDDDARMPWAVTMQKTACLRRMREKTRTRIWEKKEPIEKERERERERETADLQSDSFVQDLFFHLPVIMITIPLSRHS